MTLDLINETDAQKWAKKWLETIAENPNVPTDEGTMTGWFANAIMAGYDEGRRRADERNMIERFREIIYQAVGAATAVCLEDHPDYVFPSERIQEAVERVCSKFGIPKVEGY